MFDNNLIGPYTLPSRLTAGAYLEFLNINLGHLLKDVLVATQRDVVFTRWSSAYNALVVRRWLNLNFIDKWVGRSEPVL